MTSLPSPISSVINIWLCLISHKDNGRGGEDGMKNRGRKRGEKDTERFPPSCRQTEGTLNYMRELGHAITDNLKLSGH